jgi:glycosyltransferase involved in cell wall biosynthesis
MINDTSRSISDPVVSICIPTFNGSRTIDETLRSCLSQTFQSFEIVISDDNSTDETLNVISKFDDVRIVVLPPHESSGAANNWNRSIFAARGRFVKVMGQDDLLHPECIKTEVLTLLSNQAISPSFCFSTRSIIDDSNMVLIKSRGWIPKNGQCSIEEAAKRIVRFGGNPIGEPVVGLIDSHALRLTTGYIGSYLIDVNMWLELLKVGPAVHTQKTLMSFRVGKFSWSFRLKESQSAETLVLLRILRSAFPNTVSNLDLLSGSVFAYLKPKLRTAIISMKQRD